MGTRDYVFDIKVLHIYIPLPDDWFILRPGGLFLIAVLRIINTMRH